MNTHPILQVRDLTVSLSGSCLLNGISFTLQQGECLAITGASGSGKTTLLNAIAGKCFAGGVIQFARDQKPRIALIAQHHQFRNLSNLSNFYYQQRFNSADSEDSNTILQDLLEQGFGKEEIEKQLEVLGIASLADTRLIQLSNGEHKRFQLATALLKKPEWLLLDSPYTGLDTQARMQLNQILDKLAAEGMHILLVSSEANLPACITHIAVLAEGNLESIQPKESYAPANDTTARKVPFAGNLLSLSQDGDFSIAIKMIDANVVYGGRKILENISWEVRKGERWTVSGHNGSGKSTLLSLVNGDNPQAFANEIYLFDRKKGTGETIWDIKRRIGYVSPELHHYFEPGIAVAHVVASGLFDTIGLFRKLSEEQEQQVQDCLRWLGLEKFSSRMFNRLSNGEQRLVLLARALIKNPPLLMLDEPCQGLDETVSARFIAMIDEICTSLDKTLVYVTHYTSEIPSCITHSLTLANGRIAA